MPYHADYDRIARIVEPGSKVLDLGCGDGTLLHKLIVEKSVEGRGIEISPDHIVECIKKGISVFQGNIDEGLAEYQDKSYDYVILNRTLQVTHRPEYVIKEMLRVGKKAIVGFPNFAFWQVRVCLFFTGKTPKTELLPYEWHETPNIRWVTFRDFEAFCMQRGISIIRRAYLSKNQRILGCFRNLFPNYFAEEGIFVLANGHT